MEARLIKDICEGKYSKSNGNNPLYPPLKEKILHKKKDNSMCEKYCRESKVSSEGQFTQNYSSNKYYSFLEAYSSGIF